MLEVIYVVRHGFRANWSVDPNTGVYSISLPTPTGIAADPPLSSKGTHQAQELGAHLLTVDPPIDEVVSSPYYRCIQTIAPFVELSASKLNANTGGNISKSEDNNREKKNTKISQKDYRIVPDPGFAEWYGAAPFEHPTHAPIPVLSGLFPSLSLDENFVPDVTPPRRGERLAELHDRVATAAASLIQRADREGKRAILVCVHAAVIIAMGRVLTGRMPENVSEEDFGAFTCGLSMFRRKAAPTGSEDSAISLAKNWRRAGVGGGWVCERDSDCSFLTEGAERGWRFSGDEAFIGAKKDDNDAGMKLGAVVERRSNKKPGESGSGDSRL